MNLLPDRGLVLRTVTLFVVAAAVSASTGLWESAACAQTVSRVNTDRPADIESPEAQWIWSPAHSKDRVPSTVCFFRKMFNLDNPAGGHVQITCDDRYELFVNGQRVGAGHDWKSFKMYDLKSLLQPGRNCIAVKAANESGESAGLVARITVKEQGNPGVSQATDATWKTSLKEVSGWEAPEFDDSQWLGARSYGQFGVTAPWGGQITGAAIPGAGRFSVASEFRVERVVGAEDTGSLVAMTFNEWGEIIASREAGPLLLISDANNDRIPDTVTTYCDLVKNCQGMLALNGEVFAVGDGPHAAALYRLADKDRDNAAETVTALVEFERGMGEHGPHAIVLGPDGLIYVLVGNHSGLKKAAAADSAHHHYYEGDLVQPRYEDAGGHAVGIKSPGGMVVRTNTEGDYVQLYAGGLRNPYDITFNNQGDLLTYDSDMEWDVGLPWYRPTRILHVIPGAEFGWRSGWAKWPDYYLDSLPATLETGRGSPTGVEVYSHYMFPARYHNALFACDWSQGRILAVKLKPAGGTYEAKAEVFLEGRPLNVTDIAVGPDGWLYFSTGGRGTEGGIYRIVWTGKVPPQPKLAGVMQAIRQPQLDSAWARQRVASLKQQMGAGWERQLTAAAHDTSHSAGDRARALDLLQLVGPFPATRDLVKLSHDADPALRAKTAYLMGIHADEATGGRLVELLADTNATVRRVACESLVRGGYATTAEPLLPLLDDPERYVAWAARRALEKVPLDQWQAKVLGSANHRLFLEGATALLVLGSDRPTIDAILARGSELMGGFIEDDDFVDLLRVFQLALIRGQLARDDVPELCRLLAEEYPAREPAGRRPRINRELVRLLVHLQESSVIPRLLDELRGDAPAEEKLHLAFYARFLEDGWSADQKLALVEFYERARSLPGGHSFVGYIDNVARDFAAGFTDPERRNALAEATRWPEGALLVLATLPADPGQEILTQLIELDRRLTRDTPATSRLATGIVAVLGRSADPGAMAYLRELFEEVPDRREDLAMGLAQAPGGENWPLVVRSLAVVEGAAAQEVLLQLANAREKPDRPEPLRQAILCGLKLGENGGQHAVKLLAKWTGKEISPPDESWEVALAAWQEWFHATYPDEPEATLPVEPAGSRWTYQELVGFLTGPEASPGDAGRGAAVFEKAQCGKCHRYGTRGERIGPDLSTVSQRFQRKEILEAVVFPSQVISDQYASKTVTTTTGLTYTGIVAPAGRDAIVVLQANGEKVTLKKSRIDDTAPSRKSAMPDGLFDNLTLEEIADLFAYLSTPPKTNLARETKKKAKR